MVLPVGMTALGTFRGLQGPPGTFAGVTIEMLPYGEQPEVSMSGPQDARVLHLRVPRGLPGPLGVPTDETVAGLLASLDSDTRAAFDAVTGWVSLPVADAAAIMPVGDGVNMLLLRGYHAEGDAGAARYVRVDAEPDHGGKLQTLDGAWWEIAEHTLTIEMFGGRPVPRGVTDLASVLELDCTVPFNAASRAAKALRRPLQISEGRWAHTGNLTWYAGVKYTGVASGDNWRPANTMAAVSVPPEKYDDTSGAIFIAVGEFAREFTVDNITNNRQNGYGREIPEGLRPFDNGLDARVDLWDCTNQDAVGATPATLKPFSAAHYLDGTDQQRFDIRDVTFAVNCPLPGEDFGLGGYGISDQVVPWADVDFGVFCESPWRAEFRFDVIGYYNARGMLITSQLNGEHNRGYAEHNIIEKTLVQSGTAVRTPDSYPVIAKTSSTVTVPWSPSHRFPAEGELRIGQSAFSFTVYEYTDVSYSSAGGGTLTFTVTGSTSAITASGAGRDHVWTGTGAGFALTTFRDCELYDFSHSTLVDQTSPELGERATEYAAAVEVSGYVRAVRFENTVAHPQGPCAYLFGLVNDVEFTRSWSEPRNRKEEVADTSNGARGGLIIAGPQADMVDVVGNAGIGTVHIDETRCFHPGLNRHPYRVSSGYRFSEMEDVVTLIWRDAHEERRPRDTRDLALWAVPSTELDFRARDEDGNLYRVFRSFLSTGSVGMGAREDGAMLLFTPGPASESTDIEARETFVPSQNGSFNLGSSSRRWDTVYAVTGTINTSDGRDKEQVRELAEAEHNVAVRLKGLIRAYKWTSAVAEKGEGARIHVGVLAQDVRDAFEAEGLDARDYGVFCYDEWPEIPAGEDRLAVPAGDRFGVRYDELFAFIIAAL